jgi:hypothetical protein
VRIVDKRRPKRGKMHIGIYGTHRMGFNVARLLVDRRDHRVIVLNANVSGWDFKQGTPHPEIFLSAAEELGTSRGETFMIEDAVNGVQAAKASGMAALGLGRADDEGALAEAGADVDDTSLEGVALNALVGGHLEPARIR